MTQQNLKEDVLKLVHLKQEGDYWDFKKEWHHNHVDLLHDIICMANGLSNQDGLIIIGVDEESRYAITGVATDLNRRKTQDLVTFLRDKKFAGGIRPTVVVETIIVSEKEVDIIVVQNDRNTPYYLTENYKGVFPNNIYSRIMDTNTPKNMSSDINIIEYLWKKRFGIDAPALDKLKIYLQKSEDWEDSGDWGKRFYKYAPEFVIDHTPAEDRDGYEYYLFGQTDSRPHWYDINIYYHQTLLDSLGGVALDGGRYFTSTPQMYGLSLNGNLLHWDVSYKYFIKGTIEYLVHRFFITDRTDDESISRRKFLNCILVFDSIFEKEAFDKFVIQKYQEYKIPIDEETLPFFPEIEGYVMEEFKKDFADALCLNRMLNAFRIL